MTDAEFKQLLKVSSLKMKLIGVLLTTFGLLLVWMLTTDDPEALKNTPLAEEIFLWSLTIFVSVLGLFTIYRNVRNSYEIKRGKHPLLKAIANQDQNYVLWFYLSEAKVNHGEIYQIMIHSSDGRRLAIPSFLSKRKHILNYLRKKFPNALEGQTNENAERYKNLKK